MIDRRKIEESIFKGLMYAAMFLIIVCLLHILITLLIKGLPAMNLAMLTQTPKGGFYLGKEGGILNAILGSLYLGIGSTVLAVCLSLPIVLYLNVFSKYNSLLASVTRFLLDVLWGVPSIVYGAIGFTIMLFFGLGASLLGGIVAVTLLIMPIMSRTMDEVVRMMPQELLDASYALGATRLETAMKVVIRQSMPGIITAVLIAFGRGIGDAASVLFTAGFTDSIPSSLFQPAATLPLAIFFQMGTPIVEVQGRAYASALILTIMILIISAICRTLARRVTRNVVK